jgi:hypothetical protein
LKSVCAPAAFAASSALLKALSDARSGVMFAPDNINAVSGRPWYLTGIR